MQILSTTRIRNLNQNRVERTSSDAEESSNTTFSSGDRFEPVGTAVAAGVGTVMGAAAGLGAHLGGWAGLGIATAVTAAAIGGAGAYLTHTLDGVPKGTGFKVAAAATAIPTLIVGGIGLATGNPLLVSTGVGLMGGLGLGLLVTSQ
jgi:hypothetical protein